MTPTPSIGVVDDDGVMRRALTRLLSGGGWRVQSFASAEEVLALPSETLPDCLVLDVHMPGMGGLDLLDTLTASGRRVPVVFLTGKGDIPMTVRAMRGGAVDFLTKPVEELALFAAVEAALGLAAERRAADDRCATLRQRHATLTPREQEVFRHLLTGRLNKQVAAALGNSEQTVKVHRMRLMEKLGVHSVAELVRIADALGIRPADAD